MKKRTAVLIKNLMNEFCDQAGCTPEEKKKHAWLWQKKRWHSHPSPSFVGWWEPDGRDPLNGASAGGHLDARRLWSRKDPGGWKRGWYGIDTETAWNTTSYVEEFDAWKSTGSPEKELSLSLSALIERQKEFWKELKPVIAKIGKKMPETYLDVVNPLRGDQDEGDPF